MLKSQAKHEEDGETKPGQHPESLRLIKIIEGAILRMTLEIWWLNSTSLNGSAPRCAPVEVGADVLRF